MLQKLPRQLFCYLICKKFPGKYWPLHFVAGNLMGTDLNLIARSDENDDRSTISHCATTWQSDARQCGSQTARDPPNGVELGK
jgi:hypothetical protein